MVAGAIWLAHLPALNRVPDPANRSTHQVVEVRGTLLSVDLRRRSSRNWTSPNVPPISTPRGCTSFSYLYQNCEAPDTEFYCVIFLRHSTGRGGRANLSSDKAPYLEVSGNPHDANHPRTSHEHPADGFGRGGAGNISRDHSREPGVRNTHGPGIPQGVSG